MNILIKNDDNLLQTKKQRKQQQQQPKKQGKYKCTPHEELLITVPKAKNSANEE